jgi:hypothetical protein
MSSCSVGFLFLALLIFMSEQWLFFLKKEPKTVALRGYNELKCVFKKPSATIFVVALQGPS